LTKIAPYKVFGRLHEDLSACADGRRTKSAKAGNRGRDAALDWPLMLSFVPGILPESDEGDGKIR